jgi:hypothetical protein
LSDRSLDAVAFACACCAAFGIAALSWRALLFALPSLLIATRGAAG